jgi:outer membrane protein insertion porin family
MKIPTSGLYATFSQQYLGWDYSLLKTEAKARYFMPVFEDWGVVASVKGQAGIINSFSGGVPAVEAFQVGNSLVRGFATRAVGPRFATAGLGEVLGSTMYAGVSGELEFPLPILPEAYGVRGAIWADAAWIGGAGSDIDGGAIPVDGASVNQPLKSSVGASVIWHSPFGPIRGDAGYVITKSTEDQTQIFSLTIQNLL